MNPQSHCRSAALLVLATVLVLAPGSHADAEACPVCYAEEAEAPVLDGSVTAAAFLLAVTYGLILGGATAFVLRRRRLGRRLPEVDTP